MNLFKKKTQPLFNKQQIANDVAVNVITTATLAVGGALFVGLVEGGKALVAKTQANMAARKLAKLQAAEEPGQVAGEVTQEFNENSDRDAMVAFLKENGVVNAHAMKEETLLSKCQEVRNALLQSAAPQPA